ncbi:MAG: 16S rRNA (cytosine(1402)-N(4))-methyltransferase RsmH [Candidatus Moranbacteria bacterium]|nr:16S rRNA (cytosine(1402)-N(4))-methyltransferase RsmH [Candidatus Moranbacteria bacterium]
MIHKSVLLKEVIEDLNLKPGMTVVDGTLGAGGHSVEILKKILPGGRLISIDWDSQAVENFKKSLQRGTLIAKKELIRSAVSVPVNINKKNDNRAFSHFEKLGNREGKIVGDWCGAVDNYVNIKEIIGGLGIQSVDAVLVDLGFSSDQIESAQRGFSFLRNGPLDMRYAQDSRQETAADIVNNRTEDELSRILGSLGEEKFAKRIAREIVKARKIEKIKETGDLIKIISAAVPERYKMGRVHCATKTFQALRIETNQELENLKKFLVRAVEVLASKGILAVISFHSLEDRIVKNFFKDEFQDCVCPPNFPKCVCTHRQKLKIVTKKPITASESEIKSNPRARSAKLRVAQKI